MKVHTSKTSLWIVNSQTNDKLPWAREPDPTLIDPQKTVENDEVDQRSSSLLVWHPPHVLECFGVSHNNG